MATTYDFYFEPQVPEQIIGYKFFVNKYKRSVAVSGIRKLMNMWIKRLMTTRGSDPTDLNAGTDFPNLIGSNITSMSDIRDVVLLAIDDCTAQIKEIQRVTIPPAAEMLSRASLVDFIELELGFEAWVTLTSMQQQTATLLIPNAS